jgi:1-acyl-sn-glycerol-3-phosphate acyltransferase
MVFGEPMDFSNSGDSDDPKTLRKVTDEIMQELQRLSGQEYVDIYATAAKAKIARDEKENSDESDRLADNDEEDE